MVSGSTKNAPFIKRVFKKIFGEQIFNNLKSKSKLNLLY